MRIQQFTQWHSPHTSGPQIYVDLDEIVALKPVWDAGSFTQRSQLMLRGGWNPTVCESPETVLTLWSK